MAEVRHRWTPDEADDALLSGLGMVEQAFRNGGYINLSDLEATFTDPREAVAPLCGLAATLLNERAASRGLGVLQLIALIRQAVLERMARRADG